MLCSLALFVFVQPGAGAAQSDDDLYSVNVDVPSRSVEDRKAGAAAGLDVVLTRLSGLTTLPQSSVLRRARSAPEGYFSQYRYARTDRYDELGQPLTELNLKFSPPAVRQLMNAAELPLWTLNRPSVVLWLAERAGAGTDLLVDPEHPLLAAAVARGSFRGLPLVVPQLTSVNADSVWRRNRALLDPEAVRLGASITLVGRAEQLGPDDWQVRWSTWGEGNDEEQNLQLGGDVDKATRRAVDLVANSLVNRFTVAGGQAGTLRLVVSNIAAVADYAQVLNYLGSLSYVEGVVVSGFAGDELALNVSTTSDAAKFVELLRVESRLTEASRVPGPGFIEPGFDVLERRQRATSCVSPGRANACTTFRTSFRSFEFCW